MAATPHLDKLAAAIRNPKCRKDVPLLNEAKGLYDNWIADLNTVSGQGKQRVIEMARLTTQGSLVLAVLAAECKVNLDKTMFQEAAGTATRFKQGCPISRYFVLAEYLDMEPEDCRLTDVDNVFLLRHARRLPFEKRSVVEEVERQHKDYPIDPEVMWRFVEAIQAFVDAAWYDPEQALRRGSFV